MQLQLESMSDILYTTELKSKIIAGLNHTSVSRFYVIKYVHYGIFQSECSLFLQVCVTYSLHAMKQKKIMFLLYTDL